MMKHQFRPNDESDHLNTTLDAMTTGMRTPDTLASGTDTLADTARLINGQTAAPEEYPSDDTLKTIWGNVMQSQSNAISTHTALAPFTPNESMSVGHIPNVPPRAEPSRSDSWLSIAAMVALLVGLVGGAWGVRQSDGDDSNPIRLAATFLDETPEASPTDDSNWLRYMQPEDCNVEPMTTEDYGEIMRHEPDISGRSYDVFGPADPETAQSVARAAQTHAACGIYGTYQQEWSLETDANVFYRSATVDRTISQPEIEALNREHGMLLSETMPMKKPSSYAVIIDATPPDELIEYMRTNAQSSQPTVFLSLAFDPTNAVLLADDRVVLPATILYWPGGGYPVEQWQIDESTALSTYSFILTNVAGEWKVDEKLVFCPFEDCDWNRMVTTPEPNRDSLRPLPRTPVASPLVTPEG